MGHIKIATSEQRQGRNGVYPLHGYMKVDGVWCEVEDLRGFGGADDPRWEILAPKGRHFSPEGTHTVLAFSQADLFERLNGVTLERCEVDCCCHLDTE